MRICPQCGTRFSEPVSFCPHDGTPTQDADQEPPKDPYLGRVIDGRYRCESILGEGGMGIVYQIAHAVLGKRMALKVLRGDMARDQEVVQRFIQEAQSATQIGHPNIIDISDFGKMPDGSAYFVMEYLDGLSLTQLISRGGSIPTQKALHIIRQIASALDAAHERGIVHRDLKPDNVYVVKQGSDESFVKVLDFGIAKVGGASSKLTKTGMIFGTPHYMSPEQAAGQTVDRRTDIYALGVIMYEMFAGRVPFDGDTFMGILSKHMFQDPLPPSEARGTALGAIEDVILRALAKKVESRYQTMAELIADLDKVQAGGSVSIGRGGITPPGNLADVLEPPSRTELRLGRAPAAGPGADDMALPVKSRAPLVMGALLVLGLLGVGVGAGVFFGLAGGSVAGLQALVSGGGVAPTTGGPTTTPAPTTTVAGGTGTTTTAGTPPATTATGTPPTTTGADPSAGTGAGTLAGAGTGTAVGAGTGTGAGAGTGAGTDPGTAAVAAVTIESDPPNAEVLLEGAILGRTPVLVPRPADGEREILVRLRGYQDARVMVLPTSGASLPVTLTRAAHVGGHATTMATSEPAMTTEPAMTETTTMTTTMSGTRSEVVDPWDM